MYDIKQLNVYFVYDFHVNDVEKTHELHLEFRSQGAHVENECLILNFPFLKEHYTKRLGQVYLDKHPELKKTEYNVDGTVKKQKP